MMREHRVGDEPAEAGVPRRPSISTRHKRHDPKASSISLAHSFGIVSPAPIAAAITDVPSATLTRLPSMIRLIIVPLVRAGVPKSRSLA